MDCTAIIHGVCSNKKSGMQQKVMKYAAINNEICSNKLRSMKQKVMEYAAIIMEYAAISYGITYTIYVYILPVIRYHIQKQEDRKY